MYFNLFLEKDLAFLSDLLLLVLVSIRSLYYFYRGC